MSNEKQRMRDTGSEHDMGKKEVDGPFRGQGHHRRRHEQMAADFRRRLWGSILLLGVVLGLVIFLSVI